ncbi:extracellular solute-binding protein [Limnoglobus roseus]|uniref:Iron transporter n=1 Tax=Limnoglobus roseus TaxID=2598579 RepID=A0A5C1APW0_9BACT|nr:extracellular solute-binding protein [Limnoglobus roseus]QEL19792.1 iron transporter [Limnoglobus roseus]
MRVFLLLLLLLTAGCSKPADRVILYSAQDREFAEPLFGDFRRQSKLTLSPKFDTEANKSVSLAAELQAEQGHPRCDVHWNNEILNTIRLSRAGVYEPYASPDAADFPGWTRPLNQTWQAFAARARVLIVNTNLVPEADRPKSMFDLTDPKWRGKVAMAKPLFGTTATQAACLFEVLGRERATAFYRDLKANDVQIVPGNKQAAVRVANGDFAIGLTDTDDAIIELNAGKSVAIVFPDGEPNPQFPRMGVLYIPNTLALVKSGPNLVGGRALIDYLLTCEGRLATGGGFQIPLNPSVTTPLPPAIVRPEAVTRMEVDFETAADGWDDVQEFLRNLF